jgi:hypothetical protein
MSNDVTGEEARDGVCLVLFPGIRQQQRVAEAEAFGAAAGLVWPVAAVGEEREITAAQCSLIGAA